MAAIIEAVRDWIASCPLVEENAILGIDHLGADPIGYTVDTVPCDPVASQYVDGSQRRQFLFVFASRMPTLHKIWQTVRFTTTFLTGLQYKTSCGSFRNWENIALHNVWKSPQADMYTMPATAQHGIKSN